MPMIRREANAGVVPGVHGQAMLEQETGPRTVVEFDSFYREHYARLVRALLALTSDPAEAEDLAQEALSRLYERWDRVQEMGSPEGYLYRTALNLNRKRIRRLLVRTRRAVTLRGQAQEDLSAAEDRIILQTAVARLPRAQREAAVLVELLGLDGVEAARILGITPGAVRSRLLQARRNLREHLGGTDA
jgi:RNA polymerase sigma-70 factor (ECF subfamily)